VDLIPEYWRSCCLFYILLLIEPMFHIVLKMRFLRKKKNNKQKKNLKLRKRQIMNI